MIVRNGKSRPVQSLRSGCILHRNIDQHIVRKVLVKLVIQAFVSEHHTESDNVSAQQAIHSSVYVQVVERMDWDVVGVFEYLLHGVDDEVLETGDHELVG